MKTVARCAIILCLGGVLSYAGDWSGKLMDAQCSDKNGTVQNHRRNPGILARECSPTASTTDFALRSSTSGKIYKLDELGNAKAERAMQEGILTPDGEGEISAFVEGSKNGAEIVVHEISPANYRGSSVY